MKGDAYYKENKTIKYIESFESEEEKGFGEKMPWRKVCTYEQSYSQIGWYDKIINFGDNFCHQSGKAK